MELRHLRYFLAVAEELHFTRAAERLGIGQPPLSQQIQALERELGTELFRRLPRGVALTDAGRIFLDDARAILKDVQRATDRVQRVARGELGRIRVGMINSAPFHPFIPNVIREFRRRYPGVALTLQENSTPLLADALQNDQVDIAFVRPLIGDSGGLLTRHLFDEEVVIALPSGHALARRRSLPLLALSLEPFVLFPRSVGSGLYDEIIATCRKVGFSPRIVQETLQVTSIVNLVAAGLGVSLVPASMQQVHTDGVAYRRISGPRPRARMSLIHREDPDPTSPVSNMIRLAAQMVRTTSPARSGR
ncbi:MAG: LysR substrate-binding domain-containing protein [Nevskiales bacterium]|nr:LysR substrate-binding domain-containing protein [Nevskiales bacterium]